MMKGICTTCGDYEIGYQLDVATFICDPCASAAWIEELVLEHRPEDHLPLPEDYIRNTKKKEETK